MEVSQKIKVISGTNRGWFGIGCLFCKSYFEFSYMRKIAMQTLRTSLMCLSLILMGHSIVLGQEKYNIGDFSLEGDLDAWYESKNRSVGSLEAVGTYLTVSAPFLSLKDQYISKYWELSNISYRGRVFHNVGLVYDTFLDVVFLKDPLRSFPIKVQQDHVEWFEIKGHHFERVEGQEGFYEVLYNGDSHTLLKKVRIVKKGESSHTEEAYYERTNKYLMKMNGQLKPVLKKSSFIKLFPSRKADINNYVKANLRSKFNKDLDASLIQLAELCDVRLKP